MIPAIYHCNIQIIGRSRGRSAVAAAAYRSGEKLCWEVSGWYEDSEYRVYVDAHTGEEVGVLKMIREPMGEFAV